MDVQTYMVSVGRQARAAARQIARADTGAKNRALEAMADAIVRAAPDLLAANARDLEAVKEGKLDSASIDRLTLSNRTIQAMADGLAQVAALPDPVGEIIGLK